MYCVIPRLRDRHSFSYGHLKYSVIPPRWCWLKLCFFFCGFFSFFCSIPCVLPQLPKLGNLCLVGLGRAKILHSGSTRSCCTSQGLPAWLQGDRHSPLCGPLVSPKKGPSHLSFWSHLVVRCHRGPIYIPRRRNIRFPPLLLISISYIIFPSFTIFFFLSLTIYLPFILQHQPLGNFLLSFLLASSYTLT